jgi:dimethylaniline monooxygenase (N-oxide forming)
MESYARHFDLLKDITFGASLRQVTRNKDDTRWIVEVEIDGKPQVQEFDKVAFTHGYQTKAKMPELPGRNESEGVVIHTQQYRS